VPVVLGAVSARLGHESRVSSVVGNCRRGWVVGGGRVSLLRKLPSKLRAPFFAHSASSGNCRSESDGLPLPFRLFPATVEADKLDDDGSFGSFRRRPLLAEFMTFYCMIKIRRGVIQKWCPFGDT